jgi:hypothetical protein
MYNKSQMDVQVLDDHTQRNVTQVNLTLLNLTNRWPRNQDMRRRMRRGLMRIPHST